LSQQLPTNGGLLTKSDMIHSRRNQVFVGRVGTCNSSCGHSFCSCQWWAGRCGRTCSVNWWWMLWICVVWTQCGWTDRSPRQEQPTFCGRGAMRRHTYSLDRALGHSSGAA
jgi:hypothetical protein